MALVPLNPPAPRTLSPRTFGNASGLLKFWHLASLDAPTVALTWACALTWAARVRPAPWALVVLGLIVWVIYVIDRLLDARSARASSHSGTLQERHYFHWRHRRVLLPACVCASAAAGCIILTRMSWAGLPGDSAVGLATLAYLGKVHRAGRAGERRTRMAPRVPRECVVGLMFGAGCLLPALARTTLSWPLALDAAVLALLAWLNVAAISAWEGHSSGPGGIRKAAIALLCGCLVLAAMLAFDHPRSAQLAIATGTAALALTVLNARSASMEPVMLRAAADFVLLTPLLLLAGVGV